MRIVFTTALALGLLAVGAAHGAVAPRSLVLMTSDVPRGFVLDRDETGPRTNEDEATTPDDRRLLRQLGRVSGYVANWDRDEDTLTSRADVFRRREGARRMLDLYRRAHDRSGIKGLRRSTLSLGDQGWIWDGGSATELAFIGWRHGRVFGYVAGWGLGRDELITLARTQERRIAGALR